MQGVEPASVDTPQIHRAGKGALSLALIEARNRSLRWAAAFESTPPGAAPLLHRLGRLGWFQEHWIGRNLQRQRGERCEAGRPKLASILPRADELFSGAAEPSSPVELPDLQTLRQYLVDTLETTLELLDGAADHDDDALYFYRLALHGEDAAIEHFAEQAQQLGVGTVLVPPLITRPLREPLLFPTSRWPLGSAPGGFVPDREKWTHEVHLPEFEIDAQPVSWAQYGEFVEDGGYDDRRHWCNAGWAWLQQRGRRTPAGVEQMRHGVLRRSFGRLVRPPVAQPVMHLSWFEADAWCRWADRRLPFEAEWEAAALQGASRGWRWGDVREWTGGMLRPYPGAPVAASPGQPAPATSGLAPVVQRGASFATPGRLCSAKARIGATRDDDRGFVGFRSCAV